MGSGRRGRRPWGGRAGFSPGAGFGGGQKPAAGGRSAGRGRAGRRGNAGDSDGSGGWERRDAEQINVIRGQEQPGAGREDVIAGRRAVAEALRAGRPLHKLLIAWGVREKSKEVDYLLAEAARRHVPVERVDRERLAELAGTDHQGVVALAAVQPYLSLEDLMEALSSGFGEWRRRRGLPAAAPAFLVALDEIQDPQNVGAILRTAEAAGADGVLIPERRAAGLTAATARSAAGAQEWIPVVRVTSLPYALERLKSQGLWVVGTAADAPTSVYAADLTMPLVLVIGSEGKGLRRSTAGVCDLMVHLPMQGRIGSLNASVAAGIVLYEVVRQRGTGSRATS